MKKLSMWCVAFITLLLSSTAFALTVDFSMCNKGSNDVTNIKASVEDISGGVGITIDVSQGPVVGDITGVFFDLDIDNITISSITGYDYTVHAGHVKKAPNNSNIGGNVTPFDVGVAVGDLGLTDDIKNLTLYVIGSGVEAAALTRLGVRLQSVGAVSGKRDGSAKYVGTPGNGSGNVFPVPEPATIVLMGMGLFGIAAVARKKIV